MNIARKLLGAGAAAALAAATVGVLASPAQAASYNGACGDGYRVIDQVPLLDRPFSLPTTAAGTAS
ncbi:hypothetical protein [Actinomadura sp. WMMB 499]|uniref:hypothetical protein n=1 Tax=Actinomadura sp. WMMB 499 TaxID=1219491 RepID=UPI0034A0B63E